MDVVQQDVGFENMLWLQRQTVNRLQKTEHTSENDCFLIIFFNKIHPNDITASILSEAFFFFFISNFLGFLLFVPLFALMSACSHASQDSQVCAKPYDPFQVKSIGVSSENMLQKERENMRKIWPFVVSRPHDHDTTVHIYLLFNRDLGTVHFLGFKWQNLLFISNFMT